MAKGPSFLSKLNRGAKVVIGGVLVALTAVVYFVVFHNDLQTSVDSARTEYQKHQIELTEAEAAKQAYQKDLAELADREQRQRELSKILPQTTEYPAFLSAIQGVANITGVTLNAWTPLEEAPEAFYARVPMKVSLSGRYHQIAKFFYQVGQLDRIINMENIALQEPFKAKASGDIVLNVTALATAFHLIENGAGAADDKKGKGRRKR
ncbi:MAG TPA: type 4a pilus biogenesis protein PilO [Polyangiaceae bacterium]|nr:type 4a pilus biogenesis protein PilO [Polyangiaceae bacterium]